MHPAEQFIKDFEHRQRKLAALEKMYKEYTDVISVMLIQNWINNHRAWIDERQETYNAFKGAQNG